VTKTLVTSTGKVPKVLVDVSLLKLSSTKVDPGDLTGSEELKLVELRNAGKDAFGIRDALEIMLCSRVQSTDVL
jgi:hypothetical protein